MDRAVYFLGNDRVLNFGIAAFESFRATNPDIPAFLIPFNDELEEIRKLAERYRIEIVSDPTLARLHSIAETFWDEKHRDHAMLKKCCAFYGPARMFLYVDCDVLFLESLDPLFDKFERTDLQFLSFDSCLEYVYNAGSFRDKLVARNITRGFNAGVFLSRNDLITFDEIECFFAKHKEIRSEFRDLRDQAMLNYLVDDHRWRHLNLAELDPEYCATNNGRHLPIRERDGKHVLVNRYSPHNGKRFFLLHWNGIKLPTWLPNHLLWQRHRLRPEPLGMKVKLVAGFMTHCGPEILRRVREFFDVQWLRIRLRVIQPLCARNGNASEKLQSHTKYG
jgi:hypothetical protein